MNTNDKYGKNKYSIFCNNCGKYGHLINKCYEPITTYGIIGIHLYNRKIYDFFLMKYKFPENIKQLKNICINKYNLKNIFCNNNKDLDFFTNKITNNINFFLVKKKYSSNYEYLVNGLYDLNIENIIVLINLLTKYEFNNIINKEFDVLYDELNILEKTNEYEKKKDKFLFFIKYILPLIHHRIKVSLIYNILEFPKSIRSNNESNLTCAIKEFEKLSGISSNDYDILDRLYPLVEYVYNNNNIQYKNIYYIALLKNVTNVNMYAMDDTYLNIKSSFNILENIKTFLIYNSRYYEKYYNS